MANSGDGSRADRKMGDGREENRLSQSDIQSGKYCKISGTFQKGFYLHIRRKQLKTGEKIRQDTFFT